MDLKQCTVTAQGCRYRVRLPGGEVHFVRKDRTCSCGTLDCEAIQAVHQYLKAGGQRADDLPVPLRCPICGGKTVEDRRWQDTANGKKGFGWRCENGGIRHWMQDKTARIQRQFVDHPWLFKPVYDENGNCVSPGIRRDEIMTFEQCQAMHRRTGYDPTA